MKLNICFSCHFNELFTFFTLNEQLHRQDKFLIIECPSTLQKCEGMNCNNCGFQKHSTPFPSPELCLTPLYGLQAFPRHLALNQSPRTNAGSTEKTNPGGSGAVPASSSSTLIPETYGICVMTGLR